MNVICACSVAQLCSTLCDPLDCRPPGSSAHRISQARILEWVAISFSRRSDLPDQGIDPVLSSVGQSCLTLCHPMTAAHQASLSISNFWSSLKLMSIESVMPSSHLILCHPLLLLPPIPLSIKVFSNESALCISWPKYWSFSFSISPSNEHPGLISFRVD